MTPPSLHDHALTGLALAPALAAALGAIAWRLGSRALAACAALGAAAVVQRSLDVAGNGHVAPLAFAAIGAAFAAAPLAARAARGARIAAALQVCGRVLFYLAALALSFGAVADAVRLPRWPAATLAAVVPAMIIAAALVAAGLRRRDVDPLARGEAMLLAATSVALAIGHALPTGTGTALVANLALAFVAVGRVVRGRSTLDRASFYEGAGLIAALVLARVLELHLTAWLAALAAVACSSALAVAALTFERRRAREGAASAPGSS
jgi:hypothetical protein